MDKIAICDVIQFFFLKGRTAKKISERIAFALGDSWPFYGTLRLWVKEFKWTMTSIEEAPRHGTRTSDVTPENIDKVHDVVLTDRRVKMHELTEAICITIDWVNFILHHELHMKKLCARAKAKSHANTCQMFATVQEEFSWFFMAFCNNGRNFDPPLQTSNETTDLTRIISSEKGEKRSIHWKGDSDTFMECERNSPQWLSLE